MGVGRYHTVSLQVTHQLIPVLPTVLLAAAGLGQPHKDHITNSDNERYFYYAPEVQVSKEKAGL